MLNDNITAIGLTGLDGIGFLRGMPPMAEDMEAGKSSRGCPHNGVSSISRSTRTGAQSPSVSVLLVGNDGGCALCAWDSLDEIEDGSRLNRRWVNRLNDALNIVRNLPVALIICDLPANADGFMRIESLRQASGETPVVALTDCDSPEISRRLHELGIEDHLSRSDINSSSLRRIICRVN